jgi:hypothetical protein
LIRRIDEADRVGVQFREEGADPSTEAEAMRLYDEMVEETSRRMKLEMEGRDEKFFCRKERGVEKLVGVGGPVPGFMVSCADGTVERAGRVSAMASKVAVLKKGETGREIRDGLVEKNRLKEVKKGISYGRKMRKGGKMRGIGTYFGAKKQVRDRVL